jgi:hypothetical protein
MADGKDGKVEVSRGDVAPAAPAAPVETGKVEIPKLTDADRKAIYDSLPKEEQGFVDGLKTQEDRDTYFLLDPAGREKYRKDVADLTARMDAKRGALAQQRAGVDPTANWDSDPSGNMLG